MEDKIKKATDEMMELYLHNKIEELIKICNDENETTERRVAANMMLQFPKDGRRYN